MLFTLADARANLGKYVDSGSCKTEVVDRRIQEALERLMDMDDWDCTRRLVRVQVCGHHFTLPQNVEKILWADVDGTPVRVFGQPYQFIASGPGDLDYSYRGILSSILDKGDHWPTQFDIPESYTLDDVEHTVTGLRLFARSIDAADAGKQVTVFGTGPSGEEIKEDVVVEQWYSGAEGVLAGGVSGATTAEFKAVTRVVKPATTGYISLSAHDAESGHMTFLAKTTPAAGIPTFRRYSVVNHRDGQYNSVLALVKLRAVVPGDSEAVLPIDSMQALKLMIMSIREENAGNLQVALGFEAQAKRVMDDRQKGSTMTRGTSIIMDFDFDMSLGRTMNTGMIL